MSVIKAKINDKWEKVAFIKQVPMIVEPVVLSGDQTDGCISDWAYRYIKYHGDSITTEDITNATQMFKSYKGETIPFEINCNQASFYEMFYGAKIVEPPKMNNVSVINSHGMFRACYYLKSFPEDYFNDWKWSVIQQTANHSSYMFRDCYSLRNIPEACLKNMCSTYGKDESGTFYYYGFTNCHSLDEIKNLGVSNELHNANQFNSTVYNCARLKSFTFKPITTRYVEWAAQVLDLSTCGFANSTARSNLTEYAGFTDDTKVVDDASYQALKDNPDYWTELVAYSRYNHDSAVETINSLPNTYPAIGQPKNTIKFKGAAGELTDGGAINTLTEEEIAVAVSKNWTVALV